MNVDINYVVFDLGSTLIYNDGRLMGNLEGAIPSMVKILVDLGYPVEPASFIPSFIQRMRRTFRQREVTLVEHTMDQILAEELESRVAHSISPEHAHIRQAMQCMYRLTQTHHHPEPEAASVLKTLKDQGYHLAIFSNASNDADVQDLVDKAELRPYMDVIFSSAGVGYRKPHPYCFQMVLKHWGIQPQQAAMVGDLLKTDIVGANALGMSSVWITRRIDPKAQAPYSSIIPRAKISCLSELPDVLASWRGTGRLS